jgi:hypothetical protein
MPAFPDLDPAVPAIFTWHELRTCDERLRLTALHFGGSGSGIQWLGWLSSALQSQNPPA